MAICGMSLFTSYAQGEPPNPADLAFRLNLPFFKVQGSDIAFAVDVPIA